MKIGGIRRVMLGTDIYTWVRVKPQDGADVTWMSISLNCAPKKRQLKKERSPYTTSCSSLVLAILSSSSSLLNIKVSQYSFDQN